MRSLADNNMKIDAAALHPDIQKTFGQDYYSRCEFFRQKIKMLLKKNLKITHQIYVLNNTTHGLVVTAAALLYDNIHLEIGGGSYPAYCDLPNAEKHYKNKIKLLTHVDPLSGSVIDIPTENISPRIVDAAQSFATISYHHCLKNADVFFCPLHKHAGISAGLGVLCIKQDFKFQSLHLIAKISEQGTGSLFVLEEALKNLERYQKNIANCLVFNLEKEFCDLLRKKGVEVLTPPQASLPFVSVKGVNPDNLNMAELGNMFSMKYFNETNVLRISGACRGHIDGKEADQTEELKKQLLKIVEK